MSEFRLIMESIRQGLPHITTMDHDTFHALTKSGRVHLHSVTEKTDGSTFKMGHDKDGFYTQSSGSGSERMRSPQDYIDRVTKRSKETGKEPDYTGAKAFGAAHASLQKNTNLVQHLKSHAEKHGEAEVRGELFSRQLARPSDENKNEVKLVGTSYDPSRWGSTGQIVIHSKLPENQNHDTNHFKKNLSSPEINFEDDKIDHKPSSVDVSPEVSGMKNIDFGILNSRTTPKNRDAKATEEGKLSTIRNAVSAKVDEHIKSLNITPKFGSGSEGAVVHPEEGSGTPRFKVTSDSFRSYKADPDAKAKFKNRLIPETYIIEGGNIKIKTPSGEVAAAPFKVEDRSRQRSDVTTALGAVHNAFHQEHGEHLFGKGQKGLKSGSIYGGSTKHFMDTSISDDEFKKHKPTVGDFDVQVTHEHKDKLTSTLQPGRRFGAYTVVGMKKHGNENTAVMRHDNGQNHQVDFEATDYQNDEPTKASQFLHSADWNDTKAGIKGAHHKILLNAAGGDSHKFSITHGLRSRTDDSDTGTKEPTEISKTLFGNKAEHSKVHSFLGVSDLIKKHIPQERHQEIYDKFKSGLKSVPNTDHGPALKNLRDTLGAKDSIDEATKNNNHHTSVIPMVGFSPISHMGHAADLGGSLSRLPGTRHVGISGKSDVFSPDERKSILSKQWGSEHSVHVVNGAGETIRRSYESLPQGRRHLHILVGHDRKDFAEGLKKSLEAGNIKEMGNNRFDSVTLHYPEDTDRTHGMSGTKMRKAASEGNLKEFHRHLGPAFSEEEAQAIMDRTKGGLDSGKIKLVREHNEIGDLNHEKFGPMLDTFTQFASKQLGIKSMPSMQLSKDDLGKSFGGYNPSTSSITIATKNRHPMDIFRTLAHELVHHKQNENGNLGNDIEKEGSTGSPHENEANAEAGKIMRWFAKNNPDMFKSSYVTEDLRTWFKQNWVRFDTKGNIKGDCAREPGEGKPKCRPLASAVAMGKDARAKAARRKRRKDPVANRPGKGNEPINVRTESLQKAIDRINRDKMSEETLMEKNVPTSPELWSKAKSLARSKFDVYPSAYANGWASKWYKSKGGGWKSVNETFVDEACWDTYKKVGMKKKGNRMVPNCVPVDEAFEAFIKENKPSDREWGTDSLTNIYKEGTPGQTTVVIPFSEKMKNKRMKKEDAIPSLGYEFDNNGIGPTFGAVRSPNGIGFGYSLPMNSMAESIQQWASKPSTVSRFEKRYGSLAEKKIYEAALRLNNTTTESWEALGGRDMGTVAKQGNEEVDESSPAWQRKEGKNPTGGLNKKGISSYRAANPGSKLSLAVTTKPSKLKPGSKAANRRKSFCARMGGMPGPMKDEKGRPTRKALSLRKWNCEE